VLLHPLLHTRSPAGPTAGPGDFVSDSLSRPRVSNPEPVVYKTTALPIELGRRGFLTILARDVPQSGFREGVVKTTAARASESLIEFSSDPRISTERENGSSRVGTRSFSDCQSGDTSIHPPVPWEELDYRAAAIAKLKIQVIHQGPESGPAHPSGTAGSTCEGA
jgi:hypothetical protein